LPPAWAFTISLKYASTSLALKQFPAFTGLLFELPKVVSSGPQILGTLHCTAIEKAHSNPRMFSYESISNFRALPLGQIKRELSDKPINKTINCIVTGPCPFCGPFLMTISHTRLVFRHTIYYDWGSFLVFGFWDSNWYGYPPLPGSLTFPLGMQMYLPTVQIHKLLRKYAINENESKVHGILGSRIVSSRSAQYI